MKTSCKTETYRLGLQVVLVKCCIDKRASPYQQQQFQGVVSSWNYVFGAKTQVKTLLFLDLTFPYKSGNEFTTDSISEMKNKITDEDYQILSRNLTMVTEFLLLGFSDFQELQFVLFAIFFCLYLLILGGNITIIITVRLEHSLHTPMYFFLAVLSFSETCYTFTILPKMLLNLLSVLRTISFISCAIQMFFFLGFAINNSLLLGLMGYDRFAAICHPLRYPVLTSWWICKVMAATCGVAGFMISLLGTFLVFSLPFCNSNRIDHYFCDIAPVIHLACGDFYINEVIIFIGGVVTLMVPLTFVCITYGFIVRTIMRIPSTEGKKKAFSTCATHLIVVVVHYGCASFVYLRPSSKYTSSKDRLVTVTYTIITPLLNPLLYSLRNKDVQMAIRKVISWGKFSLKNI
ncbi:olfactory receptor 10R2-like [Antechinus flavipes]|uniref:olfactory receptor 10R2-like n=1 Tax=Antechinus flavipes TaxID=38775 RepID=UPI0022360A34|nr:olfactory receptor 10R2-like [Antechinus flavipes]